MFRQLLSKRLGLFHKQTTRCTICLRPTQEETVLTENLVQGHYVCPTCQQTLTTAEITRSLQALGLLPPPISLPLDKFNSLIVNGSFIASLSDITQRISAGQTDLHYLVVESYVDTIDRYQRFYVYITLSPNTLISFEDIVYYRTLDQAPLMPAILPLTEYAILDLSKGIGSDSIIYNDIQYPLIPVNIHNFVTFQRSVKIIGGHLIVDDTDTNIMISRLIFRDSGTTNKLSVSIDNVIKIVIDYSSHINMRAVYHLSDRIDTDFGSLYTITIIYNQFFRTS